ncbi:ATP-binding cassette subfamily C member 8 [Tanacetum coccineum]
MHILRGSEWYMMAIVEIPKTDPVINLSGVIRMVRLVAKIVECLSKADLVETKCRTEDLCQDKSVTSGIRAGRFEAMAIETEKNTASRSTLIDENRGVETSMAELKDQVEGLDGLDSDFTSMREDFRVALNTLSGDLKSEIHDLRDSFMGKIMKIREEFGEEVSTLHQVIKNFLVDDASKIKIETRYLKNTMVLWWRRRYGDIERGTATIDTWAEFVADFKKQFYPENDRNEAKSRLGKLKQFEMIREYVEEFTTLVLEILELSDQDSLFYFLNGLQGWAKMELERRGVQDHSTAIAHAEALINFSTRRESSKPKDQKVNQEKEASLNGLSAHRDEEASDGGSMGSIRILNAIKAKTEVPKVVGKGLQFMEATINGVKVRALVDSNCDHDSFRAFPSYEAKHRLEIRSRVKRKLTFLRGVGRKELGERIG